MKQKPSESSRSGGRVADPDAKLPHDRDEAAERVHEDDQHTRNREPIEQARKDVESGIVDTERIGTPNDVPTQNPRRK